MPETTKFIELHDVKGNKIIVNLETIIALFSSNNGGGVTIYTSTYNSQGYRSTIEVFGMEDTVKSIESALHTKLLRVKGFHYDNTIFSEYDYIVPSKIKFIESIDDDGEYKSILYVLDSTKLPFTHCKDTVDELMKQLHFDNNIDLGSRY